MLAAPPDGAGQRLMWPRHPRRGNRGSTPEGGDATLDLPIYFAHPYHSWERGTNENTNGLLRPYLPKGTDLTQVTPAQRRSYVHQLNHRRRTCLGFRSPYEVFHSRPRR